MNVYCIDTTFSTTPSHHINTESWRHNFCSPTAGINVTSNWNFVLVSFFQRLIFSQCLYETVWLKMLVVTKGCWLVVRCQLGLVGDWSSWERHRDTGDLRSSDDRGERRESRERSWLHDDQVRIPTRILLTTWPRYQIGIANNNKYEGPNIVNYSWSWRIPLAMVNICLMLTSILTSVFVLCLSDLLLLWWSKEATLVARQ